MKRLLVVGGVLLATLVAIAVWFFADPLLPNVTISDVRRPETLVLGKETGNPPYGITIRGSGEVDGEATLSLLLNGEAYKVEKLSGTVSFEWGGDWYSETAEIRYEPINVRSGKLIFHYRFHRL
ncbi:MAG TPA: hypothetical protein VKE98_02550 [Gemmataceae bacterium]|nr:hypothetical protein [Gemmataceae bacterium]